MNASPAVPPPAVPPSDSGIPRYFRTHGVYYGWVVVTCMFFTMFVALGFRYAFGVFYAAILADTGWTRADTAVVFSLAMGVYALTALPAGWLYDKVGARRLFTGGSVLLGAGLIWCSQATTVPGLLLSYGVLVGLSFAALGFIPHAAIVPRWFVRRRGLALAAALAGVGFGSLGMSYLSALFIEAYGWRPTMFGCGIAAWAVLVPMNALFQRPSPESIGLHPDGAGAPPPERSSATAARIPIGVALRMPAFWMLFMAVSGMGLVSMTMAVHQPRLVVDLGFSLSLSALLFGSLGLMRTVGGLTWGPLSDRIGRTVCIWLVLFLSVAGFLALLAVPYVPAEWSWTRLLLLWFFTLTFGVGYNGVSPIYASAVADRFAGPSLGTMFGLLDLGFGVGAAIGPWVAGKTFDVFHSYDFALYGMTVGVVATGVGLIYGGRRRVASSLS